MTVFTGLLLFVILYIFSFYADYLKIDKRRQWLVFLYLIIVFCIGSRNTGGWIDTVTYVESFNYNTNTLSSFSFSDTPLGYTEKGYYLLCVIAKTIFNNPQIYLFFIGALSMAFLFPSLDKYTPMPFLGLSIYIARFMLGRDMNQMRAGLAISVIMFATMYAVKRKYIKYILFIITAYFIHTSALIALPILLLDRLNIKKKHIIIGLVLAFIIAGFFGGTVKSIISNWDFVQELARTYVEEGSEKAWANNLANPLIYFQIMCLLIYTFKEKQLAKQFVYYYTIRNAYFYSTILLIVLCQYGIVAGRTSTVFATYEISIIPMIITTYKKGAKILPYIFIFGLMVFFFLKNWPGSPIGFLD